MVNYVYEYYLLYIIISKIKPKFSEIIDHILLFTVKCKTCMTLDKIKLIFLIHDNKNIPLTLKLISVIIRVTEIEVRNVIFNSFCSLYSLVKFISFYLIYLPLLKA